MSTRACGRNGFTLVELLIVIIIIGILAGMMVLSVGSASDKAEVAKIVNDIHVIKAAAVMYRLDYPKGQLLTTGGHDGKYYSESKKVAKLLQLYADGKGEENPRFEIWGGYDRDDGRVEKQSGIWLIYTIKGKDDKGSDSQKDAMRREFTRLAERGMPFMSGRTGNDSQLKPYSGGDKVYMFLDRRPTP